MKKILLLLLISPVISAGYVNSSTYTMQEETLTQDPSAVMKIKYFCIDRIQWMKVYELDFKNGRKEKVLAFTKAINKYGGDDREAPRTNFCKRLNKEEWKAKYSK
jgi:hypothetical protein